MSLREEFLQIKSKEEFLEKKEKFRNIPIDREMIEHQSRLFGECYVGGDIKKGIIEELHK